MSWAALGAIAVIPQTNAVVARDRGPASADRENLLFVALAVMVVGGAVALAWVAPRAAQSSTSSSPNDLENTLASAFGDGAAPRPVAGALDAPGGGGGARSGAVDSGTTNTDFARIIGLDQLEKKLGAATPTGKGISVFHVEGNAGDYAPDVNSESFNGVQAVLAAGGSKTNGHATATSHIIYGPSGLAPGIGRVSFFTTEKWLRDGCLNIATNRPPDAMGRRVMTHSWIAGPTVASAAILRRVDYMIDAQDVVMTVGVNNGAQTSVPVMLGSAYNVIAVGQIAGNSSGGYTTFEAPGRCKPDLVAPGSLTSFATPVVAAAAARLLETADTMKDAPTAKKAQVIKALLLAGGEKPANWKPAAGKPLDAHLGAGVLRIDRSHDMLTSGVAAPGTIEKARGWDYNFIKADRTTLAYELKLDRRVTEACIVVTWNRHIQGLVTQGDLLRVQWSDEPSLADIDLALIRVGEVRDANGNAPSPVVASSASLIDNVEHIFVRNLEPGTYRFGVRRKDALSETWTYAIAWRFDE